MKLPTLCRSGKFCPTCRDTGPGGASWRASVRAAGAKLPDAACPRGLAWTGDGPRPPSPSDLLVAPLAGGSRGALPRKPWDYRVTAVVPHLNTPDLLPLVIGLLRLQTERPYVIVVDTGSPWAVVQELERLRAPDVEVHYVRGHAYEHSSDPVTIAMDLAFARCPTPLMFMTHSDAFLMRREVLADLAGRCDAAAPVVGYRMSPRPGHGEKWRQCPGHVCAMHHVPTLDRLGVTWSIRRAAHLYGEDRGRSVWPDTETLIGALLAAAGVPPVFVGDESNGERQVTADYDHCRSTTGTKLYNPKGYAVREGWLAVAMREAQARVDRWRADDAAAAAAAKPDPWKVKGPALWELIHTAADQRAAVAEVDRRLGCGDCRTHLRAYVKANPPDGTRAWGWRLQNAVNRRLGKPELPYDEAARRRGWDATEGYYDAAACSAD